MECGDVTKQNDEYTQYLNAREPAEPPNYEK